MLLSRRHEAKSASTPELQHSQDETTATKGGSYIVGRLLKDFALGSGQTLPGIASLGATRQTYIPQPDGTVLRVTYGFVWRMSFHSSATLDYFHVQV